MVAVLWNKETGIYAFIRSKKLMISLIGIFFTLACLTVFQDFLFTVRRGSSFVLVESILFKIFWLLFIPILLGCRHYLKIKTQHTRTLRGMVIVISALVLHLLIFSLLGYLCSIAFFEGRYSFIKFLNYTLANDLYLLLAVYVCFIIGYPYLNFKQFGFQAPEEPANLKEYWIQNGREQIHIQTDEIVMIKAATPYVSIHLKDRSYLQAATLKSICDKLDKKQFIRIHKSTVVNLYYVESLKSRLNGDYDVKLKNAETLRLSRSYAAAFKMHYCSSTPVNI